MQLHKLLWSSVKALRICFYTTWDMVINHVNSPALLQSRVKQVILHSPTPFGALQMPILQMTAVMGEEV